MNIEQVLQQRIEYLFQEHNLPVPALCCDRETTVDAIEQLCDQLKISLADFFVNDLFRN